MCAIGGGPCLEVVVAAEASSRGGASILLIKIVRYAMVIGDVRLLEVAQHAVP
ncbi:Os08g0162450 [Oryza sativa Japonica Group]|uniref:Os08g0162450 protein n=1 Tax=Oryza sativa subsp. japonica TaxID=39947 RepID=C7J646_ORYSJ|nr:Os08g0162450 [Oryza sativa Japonica Group]|eukprot:NP_001175394.1 Os08g0162450 [Oryza sativa Japonica Group]